MEEKRHRRSHEEVAAAREAYLEARKAKQEARLEKARIRAEHKAEREARKAMTPEEAKIARQQKQLAKIKGRIKVEKDGPQYETYKGDINVGDFVAIRFAGCNVRGTVVSSSDVENMEESGEEFQFRKGVEKVKLYMVKSVDDETIYPVRRERIIAKRDSI